MHNTTRKILDVVEAVAPQAEYRQETTPEGGHLATYLAPAWRDWSRRYLTVREAVVGGPGFTGLGGFVMGWQIQEGLQVPSMALEGWANDQLATYAFLAEDEAAEALDQAEECARRLAS